MEINKRITIEMSMEDIYKAIQVYAEEQLRDDGIDVNIYGKDVTFLLERMGSEHVISDGLKVKIEVDA